MVLDELMKKNGLTRYRLAVKAGIPHATLSDICSGKTKLEKCSAETVYKLAKGLDVSMESLTEAGIRESQRERSYEYGLPDYLQSDLDTYKQGLRTHSPLLDCYWGELYGSINMAEISDGAITPEHADYRKRSIMPHIKDVSEQIQGKHIETDKAGIPQDEDMPAHLE